MKQQSSIATLTDRVQVEMSRYNSTDLGTKEVGEQVDGKGQATAGHGGGSDWSQRLNPKV